MPISTGSMVGITCVTWPSLSRHRAKLIFAGAPSGSGDLAAMEEILVILRQRLQNHSLTSSLFHGGTTITPSVRLARKNRGVMFRGSV